MLCQSLKKLAKLLLVMNIVFHLSKGRYGIKEAIRTISPLDKIPPDNISPGKNPPG